jgi:superoxide dismutase, Cu-Zn family
MLQILKHSLALMCLVGATSAFAETVMMNVTAPEGVGQPAGTIQITETKYGLLFTPNLNGISPGIHGFHVHVNPDCGNNGIAAGEHLDPYQTNTHLGPYNDKGHLGDLPALYATTEGMVTLPVLAPRLMHISQIKNHALMVHSGGDNYSDSPQPLGGGDGRMVCGIVK